MPDLGWSRSIAKQEEDNEIACIETAKKNGYIAENTYDCVNGSLGCKGCPFKEEGERK